MAIIKAIPIAMRMPEPSMEDKNFGSDINSLNENSGISGISKITPIITSTAPTSKKIPNINSSIFIPLEIIITYSSFLIQSIPII